MAEDIDVHENGMTLSVKVTDSNKTQHHGKGNGETVKENGETVKENGKTVKENGETVKENGEGKQERFVTIPLNPSYNT